MSSIREIIEKVVLDDRLNKVIISKPSSKSSEIKKIIIEAKENSYQVAKYTEKQVFHENIQGEELAEKINELVYGTFRQINAWSDSFEHMVMISKSNEANYKKRKIKADEKVKSVESHNRKKNYIIEEGHTVAPLVDMGVFTKDGKVVNSMYDKYKQINRFLEILDDEIKNLNCDTLNVIDFGCGKSYLTFVIYYYLTEVKGINANIIGLDLKADVIAKCNEAAKKYGYDNLRFEVGDVNGFKAPFDVDMVVTLHACDTATDYALYNAINWKAKMIFSVPCCQHELNKQINSEELGLLMRYGIIKERFSALATDAIRANLLEYAGYKTQLLEFVDFDHTPKNILIRAVRRPLPINSVKKNAMLEVENLMKEFHFKPTLYKLLQK